MDKHEGRWLEAVIKVVFDLEEGQLPALIIPEGFGTEKDLKSISHNCFPDSSAFNGEGQLVYSFYLRRGSLRLTKRPRLVLLS